MHTIDLNWLGQPQAIACYVLPTQAGVVLIDPGPQSTVETLRDKLSDHGIATSDVQHIVITHIHLDHAGAAWWWALHGGSESQRPTVHVHAFGARHLIDPSKLIASAQRIYGAQMKPMWGELQPIDTQRVSAVNDGDVLRFGAVQLEAIETPGHARHHHALAMHHVEDDEHICFTGDCAAMTVPGRDYVSLPTPPPEFDLTQWLVSVERIRKRGFDALYPTHFGRVMHAPDAWLDMVQAALRAHVAFVRGHAQAGESADKIGPAYRTWLERCARDAGLSGPEVARHVSDSLVGMNISGIMRHLHQQREDEKQAP